MSNILQLLNSDLSWNIGKSDSNVENIYTKSLYINNVNFEPSIRKIVYRQSDLDTDLTNNTSIQTPNNYKLVIAPTNATSKFRITLKIGYIIGWENNQKISFNLTRAIGSNSPTSINSDIRFTVGNQQDAAYLIYTLHYIDSLNSENTNLDQITYQVNYQLSGDFSREFGQSVNAGYPCGIIGYNSPSDADYSVGELSNSTSKNLILVEELNPDIISDYP